MERCYSIGMKRAKVCINRLFNVQLDYINVGLTREQQLLRPEPGICLGDRQI